MANWSSVLTNSTPIFYPTETNGYLLALRIAVTTSCVFSLAGSALIILTYLCFPDVRTLARQLLVNLSVADFITAAANCIGILVYYGRFIDVAHQTALQPSVNLSTAEDERGEVPENWCVAQAAFAVFGTESSILWTIAVATYMFAIVVLRRPSVGKKIAVASYLLCWGVPVVLTLWLALDGFLGYEVGATPGFCAIKGSKSINHSSVETKVEYYPIILGYDLWLYIAFAVLPVLYVAIHYHIKIKVSRENGRVSLSLHSPSRSSDLKLIFVPLVFMALRVWSIVVDISIYYLPLDSSVQYRQSYASAIFGVLEGIGVSGQGWANCILFCAFTHLVRHKIISALKCAGCCVWTHRLHWRRLEEVTRLDSKGEGGEEEKKGRVTNPNPTSGSMQPLLETSMDYYSSTKAPEN